MNCKKKVIKVIACGATVLAIGLTPFANTCAFAANTEEVGAIARVNTQTNETSYSVDNGKTWSKNAPQGLKDKNATQNTGKMVYKVLADGTAVVEQANPSDMAGNGIMIKINAETNEVVYSTDGGKTWSKNAPQGLKDKSATENTGKMEVIKVLADGTSVVEQLNPSDIADNGIMAKIDAETNKVVYSTDGGKTWVTELPGKLK
ncbi:MAG: sialidase family protein [Clostridium sp.]|uniref:sialidase family protein n=1 Tax=Clostridium sp. TaxID=1506 RepID=UPI003D6CCF21